MKIALMFSGQGSQYPEMGVDFITSDLIEVFEKIYGYNPLDALKNNNGELSQTLYVQPLMILCEIAILKAYKEKYKFDGVLGFSLGEFSAYYASGVLSLEDVFKIVKHRSIFMQEEALKTKGAMAAVLNLDPSKIQELIRNGFDGVQIANYNSKTQVVISGSVDSIDKMTPILLEKGAKRVIKLNVAGAFHSKMMENAGSNLYEKIKEYKSMNMDIPIYLNTTAKPLTSILDVHKEIRKQVSNSVLFYQTIENMINDGYDCFIEIGPGTVLSNLVKKNYDALVFNLDKKTDLNNLEGVL